MVIRNEVFEFVNNKEKVLGLIDMIQVDMKRRALGLDIQYKKVLGKDNKVVLVKQQFLSNLDYAKEVKASGGGGTGYTKIESTLKVLIFVCIYFRLYLFSHVNLKWAK